MVVHLLLWSECPHRWHFPPCFGATEGAASEASVFPGALQVSLACLLACLRGVWELGRVSPPLRNSLSLSLWLSVPHLAEGKTVENKSLAVAVNYRRRHVDWESGPPPKHILEWHFPDLSLSTRACSVSPVDEPFPQRALLVHTRSPCLPNRCYVSM